MIISHIRSISIFLTGAILVVGALTKFVNFQWFVGVLKKYDLTPSRVTNLVAFIIALVELTVGIILLLHSWLPWSAYGALALFLVFTAAVSISLARGKFGMECGCNSLWKKSKIGWLLVFRNLGLTGLAFLSSAGEIQHVQSADPAIFLLSVTLMLAPFLPKRSCQ